MTSKLDDVIDSNLNLRMPQRIKRPLRKGEVPNYGIDNEDEVEDMGLGDLIEQPVLPELEKQIVPKPPTYEESLEDIFEGKEIYVDPKYFPEDPKELPPEYNNDEEFDYAISDEDIKRETLNDLGVKNYESVNAVLNQSELTPKKKSIYLSKIVK